MQELNQTASSAGAGRRAGSTGIRWQGTVKVLLSATVLVLLAYIIDWESFLRIASAARTELLIIAAVMMFIENLMVATRWNWLLTALGVPASWLQTLRSYLKGHFVAYFVPASVTADVVKGFDLNLSRARGTVSQGVEVASSIFVERAFGAVSVGLAVVIGLSVSPMAGEHASLGRTLLMLAGGTIACCVGFMFADKFFGLLPTRLLTRFHRVRSVIDRAERSLVAYRRRPLLLIGVTLLSFAIQAMRVVPVFIIAVAIGSGTLFFAYLISVPIIYLINTLPVIGSRIGTEQGMFVLLLGLAGVDPESALIVALVSLVLGVIVSLPGGYWLIAGKTSRSSG